MGRFGMQPGGRFVSNGFPMTFLVQRASNMQNGLQIVGLPKWADTVRFDITAKAPASAGTILDTDAVNALILSLLKDRFGLKYHTEERPLNAYSLVAVKPKLKKADPASRTHCLSVAAPAGSPPGSVTLTCQNTSMALFAEQLRGRAQGLLITPLDATGLEGGWDFTLLWNQRAGMTFAGPGRGGDGAPPADGAATASDPTGGLTIFDAVEKQLGLKLEMQKRPLPVFVIDQLNEKPTDN
jgi:uncharacterized protein (TIGR03435 family)